MITKCCTCKYRQAVCTLGFMACYPPLWWDDNPSGPWRDTLLDGRPRPAALKGAYGRWLQASSQAQVLWARQLIESGAYKTACVTSNEELKAMAVTPLAGLPERAPKRTKAN